MKIGIFTDAHYCSREGYQDSFTKIEEALIGFVKEGCAFAVFLGDLVDKENSGEEELANLREISALFNKYPIKTYVVVGNHDTLNFEKSEFYAVLGEKHRPENFSLNDRNFIFIDTCCERDGADFAPQRSWSRSFFVYEKKLKKELCLLQGTSNYVFMHYCADPNVREGRRIANAEELRVILERDGRPCKVFQGHDHEYVESTVNGIDYITYPDMLTSDNAYFIVEI